MTAWLYVDRVLPVHIVIGLPARARTTTVTAGINRLLVAIAAMCGLKEEAVAAWESGRLAVLAVMIFSTIAEPLSEASIPAALGRASTMPLEREPWSVSHYFRPCSEHWSPAECCGRPLHERPSRS